MTTSSFSVQTLPPVSSTTTAPWRSLSSREYTDIPQMYGNHSRSYTNVSRMLMMPSRGATMSCMSARSKSQWGDESYSDFLLLFNRLSLNPFITYLMLDKKIGHSASIVPKISSMFMTRLKDIVQYRIVCMKNMVYVLGGLHADSQTPLSYCHRFDPYNNQWQSVGAFNKGRCRFAAAVLGEHIYISGGVIRNGKITSTVECYDVKTDAWTEVRPMPEGKMNHSMCASGSKIYVSGGIGRKKTTVNTCSFWQYDPHSDFWWSCTNLPHPRWNHSMVDHRGTIYIVGGETIGRHNHRYVDLYDTSMNSIDTSLITTESGMMGKWMSKDCPMPHKARSTPGMFSLGHRLYLLGGSTNGESVNSIEYYSPPRKKWIECFYMGKADYSAVDCVVVRVPQHNKQFNHLTHALHGKFVFW